MAGLDQFKFAMGTGIFIAVFIFAVFLALVLFIIQVFVALLTLSFDLIRVVAPPVLLVLFQYAIGPSIVKMSSARIRSF